jgi:hypothetical protein
MTDLNQRCAAIAEATAHYLASQSDVSRIALLASQDLKASIAMQMDEYNQRETKRAETAAKEIEAKANAMEKAIASMMKEMVKSSVDYYAQSSLAAQAIASSIKATSDSGIDAFEGHVSAMQTIAGESMQSIDGQRDELDKLQVCILYDYLMLIHVMIMLFMWQSKGIARQMEFSSAVDGNLSNVSGSVSAKREQLESTVSSLVRSVDTAVTEACQCVDSTAQTASEILQDISKASEVRTYIDTSLLH